MRDVVELARRLAPHSNRLRAYLALMGRPKVRADWRFDSLDQLQRLVVEVMADLGVDENGEFVDGLKSTAPTRPLRGFDDAARWMARPDYLATAHCQEMQWTASREGAYAPLLDWERRMVKALAEAGIPIYARTFVRSLWVQNSLFVRGEKPVAGVDAPHCHGMAVDLCHCLLSDLPAECWRVLFQFGSQFARERRLRLLVPSPAKPWHWEVADWRELKSGASARLTVDADRTNWSRPPPGERERLLEFYGIKNEPWAAPRQDEEWADHGGCSDVA